MTYRDICDVFDRSFPIFTFGFSLNYPSIEIFSYALTITPNYIIGLHVCAFNKIAGGFLEQRQQWLSCIVWQCFTKETRPQHV